MATEDTRTRLLDACERLFAEKGVQATGLREITGAASVNLAAVHYHFGSKDDLALAVFKRRVEPVNAERLARLDALEAAAAPGALSLENVIEAFLAPAMRFLRPEARGQAQLLGRLHHESNEGMRRMIVEEFSEVVRRYLNALGSALPDMAPPELLLRGHFMVGAMIHVLTNAAQLEHAAPGLVDFRDAERILAQLVAFVAAGFRAPATTGENAPGPAQRGQPQ